MINIVIPDNELKEMGDNIHCPKCGEYPKNEPEEIPMDESYTFTCQCGCQFNVEIKGV